MNNGLVPDECAFLISLSPLCAEFPAAPVPLGTPCPGKCLEVPWLVRSKVRALWSARLCEQLPSRVSNAWALWPGPELACIRVSALCPAGGSSPTSKDLYPFELPPFPYMVRAVFAKVKVKFEGVIFFGVWGGEDSQHRLKTEKQAEKSILGAVSFEVLQFILSGELCKELVLKFCSLVQRRQRKYVW